MKAENVITVRDFRKVYGSFVAVDNISFEVGRGEIFGLLGPNGAGKTSTLECLEGIRRGDGGSLAILGVDPTRQPRRLADLIGVQLQTSALPESMTAHEAIAFFCAYHKVAPRHDLIERLGLAEKRHTQYRQLSTGQQRRLALALAVAHRPPVVILDEPTAGLDVGSRTELHAMMAELRADGVSILLATHDMEREVLVYQAPLYGRRTVQWHLQPLSFADARLFLPGYSLQDQVRAYAVLGGVPAYLRQFADRRPLLDNIEGEILSQGAFLYDEPRFLLQMELREPRVYFAILEAIATGRVRQEEISQAVGVKGASLGYYLNTLRDLGLLERTVPVTDAEPAHSRQGCYQLLDPFFRFWFRFVW